MNNNKKEICMKNKRQTIGTVIGILCLFLLSSCYDFYKYNTNSNFNQGTSTSCTSTGVPISKKNIVVKVLPGKDAYVGLKGSLKQTEDGWEYDNGWNGGAVHMFKAKTEAGDDGYVVFEFNNVTPDGSKTFEIGLVTGANEGAFATGGSWVGYLKFNLLSVDQCANLTMSAPNELGQDCTVTVKVDLDAIKAAYPTLKFDFGGNATGDEKGDLGLSGMAGGVNFGGGYSPDNAIPGTNAYTKGATQWIFKVASGSSTSVDLTIWGTKTDSGNWPTRAKVACTFSLLNQTAATVTVTAKNEEGDGFEKFASSYAGDIAAWAVTYTGGNPGIISLDASELTALTNTVATLGVTLSDADLTADTTATVSVNGTSVTLNKKDTGVFTNKVSLGSSASAATVKAAVGVETNKITVSYIDSSPVATSTATAKLTLKSRGSISFDKAGYNLIGSANAAVPMIITVADADTNVASVQVKVSNSTAGGAYTATLYQAADKSKYTNTVTLGKTAATKDLEVAKNDVVVVYYVDNTPAITATKSVKVTQYLVSIDGAVDALYATAPAATAVDSTADWGLQITKLYVTNDADAIFFTLLLTNGSDAQFKEFIVAVDTPATGGWATIGGLMDGVIKFNNTIAITLPAGMQNNLAIRIGDGGEKCYKKSYFTTEITTFSSASAALGSGQIIEWAIPLSDAGLAVGDVIKVVGAHIYVWSGGETGGQIISVVPSTVATTGQPGTLTYSSAMSYKIK